MLLLNLRYGMGNDEVNNKLLTSNTETILKVTTTFIVTSFHLVA